MTWLGERWVDVLFVVLWFFFFLDRRKKFFSVHINFVGKFVLYQIKAISVLSKLYPFLKLGAIDFFPDKPRQILAIF